MSQEIREMRQQAGSTPPKRRNRRQHQFKVITYGIRRDQPDFKRMAAAFLELYLSLPEHERERLAQEGMAKEAERRKGLRDM